MPNALYKDHLLVWKASYDQLKDRWIPKVFVSWPVNGKYQLHYFHGPPQDCEADAFAIGKQLAEAWVEGRL